MKTMRQLLMTVMTLAALMCFANAFAADAQGTFDQSKAPKIALVNFKTCVEKSKIGQKEQASFDAMKKQMETILEEKEKSLADVAGKFNDIDYLDSLSPDAEAELKRQFRTLNAEFNQQQQQFYQTLSQTNMMIIQKLNDAVTKAAEEVAKSNKIDIVLNDESTFYTIASIDISPMVIRVMDTTFEKEAKNGTPGASLLDMKK